MNSIDILLNALLEKANNATTQKQYDYYMKMYNQKLKEIENE